MNPDSLAFLNRQLASLLQDGIPLEGALRQAAADLRGPLRDELIALESDLSKGLPLIEAIGRRRLPLVYLQLVQAGIASGNLPGALATAADHFEETARLKRRVQAALFYPTVVLVVGAGISAMATRMNTWAMQSFVDFFGGAPKGVELMRHAALGILFFFGMGLVILAIGPLRRWVGARVPGFRDARLAQMAGTFHLLLAGGCPLPEAIRLVRELEQGSPAARDLTVWQSRIEQGFTRLADVSQPTPGCGAIPPLFRWLVLSAGDRVTEGFGRASKYYRERAQHRMNIFVNGLVPLAVFGLGVLIVLSFLPMFAGMVSMLNTPLGE